MRTAMLFVMGVLCMASGFCAEEGLKVLSAGADSVTAAVPERGPVAEGTCVEIRKGGDLIGFAQVKTIADGKAECKLLAGKADAASVAIPIAPPSARIALVTDDPNGRTACELNALYPGLVTTEPDKLSGCDAMVCVMHDPEKAKGLDFSIIRGFAASGRTAIVSLSEYARATAAKVDAVRQKAPLQIRIERVTDLTRGTSVGQKINWYGTEGEGEDPKKKDKFHTTIAGLPESKSLTILAASAANGNAIFVEEKVGDGRIIAMDLNSPNEAAGYDAGSKNKWVFAGNILGRTVHQAKYRTEKLPYDDFVNLEKVIVEKRKDRAAMKEEGKGSDDDPTYSLMIGNPSAPRFLILGAIHGGEWKNSYALLDVIETLLDNPDSDYKIDWLPRSFSIKFIPIVNVAGYKKYGQVNKNDCDLNRNYPFHWDVYKGDGGWRAKYAPEVLKGKAPFSEAESQIIKRIVEEEKPIGLIDMHMHGFESGHMICCPHKDACPDLGELQAVKLLIDQRLRNRYLFGRDKEGKCRQIQLRGGGYGGDRPFLVNWAGSLGIHSTVFESVGGFEDSLPHGDVVIEDCLNFLYVVAANHLSRRQ